MLDICYNRFVDTISWKDYITARYLDWRADKHGRRGSAAMFARELEITPQLLNSWMNKGQKPTDPETISLLAKCFGDDVYVVLGYEVPGNFDAFPARFQDALREAKEMIISRGLVGDTQESLDIISDAIRRAGYTVTRIQDDSSSQ